MITNFLLLIIYTSIYLFSSPLRLFDDASLPSGVSDSLTQLGYALGFSYDLVPVTTVVIMAGLTLMVGYAVAYIAYKGFMWIIKKIPGVS